MHEIETAGQILDVGPMEMLVEHIQDPVLREIASHHKQWLQPSDLSNKR
jgi:hypothetical protein